MIVGKRLTRLEETVEKVATSVTAFIAWPRGMVKATLKMTNMHQVAQSFPTVEATATFKDTLLELLPW